MGGTCNTRGRVENFIHSFVRNTSLIILMNPVISRDCNASRNKQRKELSYLLNPWCRTCFEKLIVT
jgi:hypothetical protein